MPCFWIDLGFDTSNTDYALLDFNYHPISGFTYSVSLQVGIAEMKVAIEKTGGLVVLAESFGHSVFKDSFKRIFEDGEQSLGLSFK